MLCTELPIDNGLDEHLSLSYMKRDIWRTIMGRGTGGGGGVSQKAVSGRYTNGQFVEVPAADVQVLISEGGSGKELWGMGKGESGEKSVLWDHKTRNIIVGDTHADALRELDRVLRRPTTPLEYDSYLKAFWNPTRGGRGRLTMFPDRLFARSGRPMGLDQSLVLAREFIGVARATGMPPGTRAVLTNYGAREPILTITV